jgi:translocation protein SEC63
MATLKGQPTADPNAPKKRREPVKKIDEESDYESGTDEDEESDSETDTDTDSDEE